MGGKKEKKPPPQFQFGAHFLIILYFILICLSSICSIVMIWVQFLVASCRKYAMPCHATLPIKFPLMGGKEMNSCDINQCSISVVCV